MELAVRQRQRGGAVGQPSNGQWQQTEATFGRPLARDAVDIEALLLLGLSLAARGQTQRAAAILDRVARERPQDAHPCHDLPTLLPRFSRAQIAAQYRACLRLAPEDLRLRQVFIEFLLDGGEAEAAVDLLREGLRQTPGSAAAQHTMGQALAELGRTEMAIWHFRQAVTADPGQAASWASLGALLKQEQQFDAAIAAYAQAVAAAPADAQIRVNRAVALLHAGRWTEAWRDFEWRLRPAGAIALPLESLLPMLDEAGDLTGRTVLLTHEEGFGDTIQFLRYAPLLAARGARVLAWVPQPLVRLVRSAPGVSAVFPGDRALPPFDFHCPFVSLPRVFGTTVTTVPGAPYLAIDPALAAQWAHRLPAGAMRVGLVWAGPARPWLRGFTELNRRPSAGLARAGLASAGLASAGLAGVGFAGVGLASAGLASAGLASAGLASAGLAAFAPLLAVQGVRFVSLQKRPQQPQSAALSVVDAGDNPASCEWPLCDPMEQVEDFADTGAIVANLDLVVSVDTAVVHLAGAMGKPVFLVDRYDNCWRWLSGRVDSPWYPAMTIFRQEKRGDWSRPMARAAAALRAMAAWRGVGGA